MLYEVLMTNLYLYPFQFEAILHSSAFYKTCGEGKKVVDEIWSLAKAPMFSLTEKSKQLGLGTKGVTKYFSSNCDEVCIFKLKSDPSDGLKNYNNYLNMKMKL